MSYIITAIISAMIGGAVGLFVGCACAVAGKADEMEEKRNDYYRREIPPRDGKTA